MVLVIVTDLTRMSGSRICVAGYRLERDRPTECIRPELEHEPLRESWLFSAEGYVRPFSILDVGLVRQRPVPPHTEDWVIERRYSIVNPFAKEHVETTLVATAVESVRSVYGDDLIYAGSWRVPALHGTRSLGTVEVKRIHGFDHHWDNAYLRWAYRLRFTDEAGDFFNLSVTDLVVRYLSDFMREQDGLAPPDVGRELSRRIADSQRIFLRLGLSRPFGDQRDQCFLQVTGIHTIPDYLEGACFLDYRPDDRLDLSDVPF